MYRHLFVMINGTNPLVLMYFNIITIICTLFFGKRAIFMHACFVTFTLITIVIHVKAVFVRVKLPLMRYRQFIILFSLFHLINPLLMTMNIRMKMYCMYVHLLACFLIHLFHMQYITTVFELMNYKDDKHWMILLLLNILEMCTNLCLVCNYDATYLYTAIVTECMCPYVLMYVRKRNRRSIERFSRLNSNITAVNVPNARVIHVE